MSDVHRTPQTTAKPTHVAEKSPGSKGATPTMGEPLSPTGPNETEEGIIKAQPPEPPGPDQIGLVGGDPTESLQSTPPLDVVEPSKSSAASASKK